MFQSTRILHHSYVEPILLLLLLYLLLLLLLPLLLLPLLLSLVYRPPKVLLISDPDTKTSAAAMDVHVGHFSDPGVVPKLRKKLYRSRSSGALS